ncbi:MAG: hypothetical protein PHV34_20875 [Verrucomicrobiae bacterium]|nr:hypothetical protein [Verrucomicrobiae bacterium]
MLNQHEGNFLCVDRQGFYVINYRDKIKDREGVGRAKDVKRRFVHHPRKDKYYVGGFFSRTEMFEMFPELDGDRILGHFNALLGKGGG